ncbi:MAG: hypothetical protein Phog2KO_08350 [Phototrophicaceae bacterium]
MAKRKSPKQRKEERQQEKQRGQQRIFIGVAVVVAIFAAIIFALTSLPADAELPTGLDRYEDFMTSTTDEGYAVLGNPNAPVTVREYSSFSCPGCMEFHRTTFSQLLPAIENGAVKFVYIPLQTGSVANPEGAARTAICAGEQGMFWEMHDVLFFWQETYGTTAFQDSRIRTGVQELGLSTSDFNSCFRSNATSAVLTAAQNEGVGSTPSIEVNGVLLPNTSFETISEAITSNLGAQTSFESGLISDASEETETDDVEATEEAVEATEEAEMDDMEATEEAEMDDTEATEEAE